MYFLGCKALCDDAAMRGIAGDTGFPLITTKW
jgi:hypothetical protein